MLRNHDLMPLPGCKIENAQHFMHRRVWIAAHAAIINAHEELASMLIATHLFRYIDEMSGAAIVRAHDVQFPIVPLISSLGIQNQVYMGIFREAKLLNLPVPVLDADEEFFDVTAGGIRAEGLVGHIEAQNSVVHKGSYLSSDVNAVVACAKLSGDQFAALCRCEAGEKKHACQTAKETFE